MHGSTVTEAVNSPGLLPEEGGLSGGDGGGGVCVAIERKDLMADVVLNEAKGPGGTKLA